ncbi:MAG: CusA/CzcA family heavy metal efflux RND transporter [Gemmatimonadaceae bacterium]
MINRLIALALRFRAAVIAAVLILVAGGTWAFATLNLDAFPELTPNQVLVMTSAPGLSASEVENLVSFPIETALLGLPRAQDVRSLSKATVSVVTVTFDDDVDLYFARAQVQQRMQDVAMELGGAGGDFQPMLGPPSTAMSEAFQYLVESDSLSPIDLRNVQEYTIKPLLRTIPGVADVNSWGGMAQQFQVITDPTKLSGYGVTIRDLEMALANNNDNFGAGYIEDRGERLRVRGLGRATSVTDIGNIVVATRAGTPIFVRDVAQVVIGAAQREGAVSRDAKGEALSGTVVLVKGANSHRVLQDVVARLPDIQRVLPRGVRIRPFYNQAEVVENTTRTVFRNLIEGALLVILVLFLFLRDVRASLITASVIPLSMLIAFIAMRRFGVSANLMSLGALDFGLLVDASVVMVENFVRKLGPAQATDRESRAALIRHAAFEVGRPVVFGVCIIIAVYIPIFTLQGLEGRMFRPMAFTVCVAVLGSLVLALTYVPAVSAIALRNVRESPARWFEHLRVRYGRLLEWSLSHRRTVIGAAFATLAIALASLPFIGTEFMPRLDEGSLLIETRRVPGTALAQGVDVSRQVERTLLRFPEVSSVVTNLGRPEMATETMPLFAGDVYIGFKPRREWRVNSPEALIEKIDSALAEIPGLDYDFSAPMAMRLDEVLSGVRTQLGVKVFGDSLQLLQQKAEEIEAVVASVRGAEDISARASAVDMQLELDLDRTAMARFGLNVADVRDAMQAAVGGVVATEVIDGRKRFPVVVRLADAYRASPEAIGQLLIPTPAGGRVALSQIARVRVVEGLEQIDHEGAQRLTVVQANVRGRDLGSFVAEVRREIERRVQLPEGYYVSYGGQFENQQRATRRLLLIVPVVLLLIMALLYASFGNGRHAVLVMLNVPFALVGGIGALWLRGINLNLSASVGFIALFGVAVLNGVVLLTYLNQLRSAGTPLRDAIREAADTRLRPVLMTALVAAAGFLPMAISQSQGAEVQRPLATVVIGGLITSTLLTLVVLPAMYEIVEARWPAVRTRLQVLRRSMRTRAMAES